MTAGRGIALSERSPAQIRTDWHSVHALQLWVALPQEFEETAPAFIHYEANQLPVLQQQGLSVRVMIGEAFGLVSPVTTFSPTFFLETRLVKGTELTLPTGIDELGVYVVSGCLRPRGTAILMHTLAIFDSAPEIKLTATKDCHLIMIGGRCLGKRTVWWNLVATRRDLIGRAKSDWRTGRFSKVPCKTECIPLPNG